MQTTAKRARKERENKRRRKVDQYDTGRINNNLLANSTRVSIQNTVHTYES